MREKLLDKLYFKQAVSICRYYSLGNMKLIEQLSTSVIKSDYIIPANLSYNELVKAI